MLFRIQEWINAASKIVGFSGAGISTESGIPDFRSPGGVWSQYRTVYFDEFLSSREARVEYWHQKKLAWPVMRDAVPNEGHLFFSKLHEQGKLLGMITQNIDKLHERAGLPKNRIVELHGNTADVTCLNCGQFISMDAACERIEKGEEAPECLYCGGLLKPATISFGQALDEKSLDRVEKLCRQCDLFIAAGSSLVVQPAASFPLIAKRNGAKLVIINRTETPLDPHADAVIHESIGITLKQLKACNS